MFAPNPVPVIVTALKTLPLSGEIELMTGAASAPSPSRLPARASSTALPGLFAGFAPGAKVGCPSLMGASLDSRHRANLVSVIKMFASLSLGGTIPNDNVITVSN